MKLLYKTILICVLIILVTGCGKNKSVLLNTCTKKNDGDMLGLTYQIESEYKIYAKGKYVDKIEITENVKSDYDGIISNYYDYFNGNYEYLNNTYGGFENKLSLNITEIKSETVMYFDKINVKDYVNDNEYLKDYLVNNKIKAEGFVDNYQKEGAICK